ncbi:hypothetical protein [Chitinophaga nivalis]|uniref:DUF2780 domain-containing protein n=1 Tax=Chitinophaga nivalis TaxID=2991709 RepID=A0ABT3IHV7_9BACT|nr:hypothetical protein [Chitinophaga nivalis]MCW3466764.1 hypothetical protein [Chitinophaga nivalis]MCW3483545.1 hypothetical protein [Chitinophaga nivalis]
MAKKFMLLLFGVCFLSFSMQAQGILDQAKKVTGSTQNPLSNSGGIANAILGQLTPALGLNNTQQPKLLNLVSGFLKQKAGILPLQQTNPAGYTSKLGGLQKGLFGKIKTLLTVAQYTKFLGLKPATNDAGNVLSQLFY